MAGWRQMASCWELLCGIPKDGPEAVSRIAVNAHLLVCECPNCRAAWPRKCLMDVGSQWRDEAPIASQLASFHDRAQNLRRPFQQHRPPMPVEVLLRAANLDGMRAVSVVLEYFAAHYNIHYRPVFQRSSGQKSYLEPAKSPLPHHSPPRLRLHSVRTRSRCEKPQAPVHCVVHQAV